MDCFAAAAVCGPPHHEGKGASVFSTLAVCYLFLGGVGGGAAVVLGACGLVVPRAALAAIPRTSSHFARGDASGVPAFSLRDMEAYRRLLAPLSFSALVLLSVGMTCLLVDLGSPARAVLLFASPHASFVAVGAWVLAGTVLVLIAQCAFWGGWLRVPVVAARAVQLACAALGVATALYTGLMLSDLQAVPLWSTPLLPALFALSSLSCGLALAVIAACFSGASRPFAGLVRTFERFDAAAIAVEGAVLAVFIARALSPAGQTATDRVREAAGNLLIFGPEAWAFWALFVGAGLIAPFAFDVAASRASRTSRATSPFPALFAMACVLVGGFAMRYCIVGAGMQPYAALTGTF